MPTSLSQQYRIIQNPSDELEGELVDLHRRMGAGRPPFLVIEHVDMEAQTQSILRMMDLLGVPVPAQLDEASWMTALQAWLPLLKAAQDANTPEWKECEVELAKRDLTPFVQFLPSEAGFVLNLPARCLHATDVLDRLALETLFSGNLEKTVHAIGSRFGEGEEALEMTDVLFEEAADAAAAALLLLSQESGDTYAVFDERMPSASEFVESLLPDEDEGA